MGALNKLDSSIHVNNSSSSAGVPEEEKPCSSEQIDKNENIEPQKVKKKNDSDQVSEVSEKMP